MEAKQLEQLATAIHENAVEHGWWDEERPFDEIAALCSSELAEALEESRAGRAMVWYDGDKPEGIAVEMADCLIRILDYFGKVGFVQGYQTISKAKREKKTLSAAIMATNYELAAANKSTGHMGHLRDIHMASAACEIVGWFGNIELDVLAVVREKHEYNKTRPYKHGKKF